MLNIDKLIEGCRFDVYINEQIGECRDYIEVSNVIRGELDAMSFETPEQIIEMAWDLGYFEDEA